jgi:iron(III) transport system permease protein
MRVVRILDQWAWATRLAFWLALGVVMLLMLPVLSVGGSWWWADADTASIWSHLWSTVIGEYSLTSLALGAGVAVGVTLVGGSTAAAVTLLEFPGRRSLEWALLLPMAMPAYVLAYVYTDTLQFSGPLQTTLRDAWGLEGRLWPDVRSLPGAMVLMVLCLYPYVYLLTRAALSEQGARLMEAARLLGAGVRRRILHVALPLARPAIAAGVALALMETLADYGVGAYFGLSTFTTGIYRAWLSMDDPVAAAQLASLLMVAVFLLMAWERRARKAMRTSTGRPNSRPQATRKFKLRPGATALVWLMCVLPVLLGFVLPVLALGRLMWQQAQFGEFGLPWADFLKWSTNSLMLATVTSLIAVWLSLVLGHALRMRPTWGLRAASRVVALGYAVPGAVIAVGLLLPLGLLQTWWAQHDLPLQWSPSALVTGSVVGVVYAYLVRFSSVALQSIEAGYAQMPPSLDESARLLGVKGWALWRQVHAPMLWRPALAAALLVFVDTMKELPATLVLRPFDTDTLAVVAYQLARDERLGEAALPSLAMVLVGLVPVLMLSRAMRR